jgi:hypothetical protein
MKKHISVHDAAFVLQYILDTAMTLSFLAELLKSFLQPLVLQTYYRCTYYVFVSSLVLEHTFRVLSILAITSKVLII